MFGRLVDVYLSNENDSYHIVDSSLGNKSLVCEAKITIIPGGYRTSCVLTVYNIDKNIKAMFKANNYKYLLIKFGYKDVNGGVTSTIFEGTVQRMIVQRDDPTTTRCIMYAYSLGDAYNYGYFSGTITKGTSVYDALMTVANAGITYTEESEKTGVALTAVPIPLVCSDYLKTIFFTKDETYFDTQMNVINEIVKNVKNIEMQVTLGKLYISTIEENDNTEVIVMSGVDEKGNIVSTSGLINMPTLEDDGLSFQCLINTDLKIYSRVLIANSLVSNAQEGFKAQSQVGAVFDENGIYVVVRIVANICNNAGPCKMTVRALARDMYMEDKVNETN